MDEITEVKIFIDKQGRRMNKDNLPKVHIHDFDTYTGEKSEYLKQGESYCVKAVSNCPQCGDELLELYGFKDGISHCRFCDAPIFNNCFSRSRFIIQTNAYNAYGLAKWGI